MQNFVFWGLEERPDEVERPNEDAGNFQDQSGYFMIFNIKIHIRSWTIRDRRIVWFSLLRKGDPSWKYHGGISSGMIEE